MIGAAYGTAQSAIGVSAISSLYPRFAVKGLLPVIFAGVTAIYGLVIAVIILTGIKSDSYTLLRGFMDLAAGLSTGLAGLASGIYPGYWTSPITNTTI